MISLGQLDRIKDFLASHSQPVLAVLPIEATSSHISCLSRSHTYAYVITRADVRQNLFDLSFVTARRVQPNQERVLVVRLKMQRGDDLAE